jgi:transcription antitermination factor NusG
MDLRKFDQFWFALQVRPACEQMASSILSSKGYEQYLPLHIPRGGKVRARKCAPLPLFPGYLFCRFNASANAPIVTTPGVIRIVGIGKTPVAIKDEEIADIRALERCDQTVRPFPFLKIGDPVRVVRGPLAGVQGLLVNVKNSYQFVVSIDLLCRSIAIDIDAQWIDEIRTLSPLCSPAVGPTSLKTAA